MLNKFYAPPVMLLAAITGFSGANAQEQTDPNLSLFRNSSYTLAVDDQCQVLDYVQLEAAEYIQAQTYNAIKQRYAADALEAEKARVAGLAKDAWTGCLDRATHAEEWAPVDQTRLYSDAIVAAPALMPETIVSCGTAKESYKVRRSEMIAAQQERAAAYVDKPDKATFEEIASNLASGIAPNCEQLGYSADMIGAMTARDRRDTSRKHEAGQMTSIGEFGPWTSFRYFSFESQDEMEALAYRASGPQANNIVGLNLDAPGVLGNSGRLHVTRQGDWVAALNGRADKLEVRADGIAPVQFARVSQPGTEDISGKTQFQLSAAKAQALMDLSDDTNLTFFHQPVGQDEWVQFESVYDRPGHLPLGRLKEAIAWASAPKSPGF